MVWVARIRQAIPEPGSFYVPAHYAKPEKIIAVLREVVKAIDEHEKVTTR